MDEPNCPMEVAPAMTRMGVPAYLPRPPATQGGRSFAEEKRSFPVGLYSGNTAVARPLGIVAASSKEIESGTWSRKSNA